MCIPTHPTSGTRVLLCLLYSLGGLSWEEPYTFSRPGLSVISLAESFTLLGSVEREIGATTSSQLVLPNPTADCTRALGSYLDRQDACAACWQAAGNKHREDAGRIGQRGGLRGGCGVVAGAVSYSSLPDGHDVYSKKTDGLCGWCNVRLRATSRGLHTPRLFR